MATAADMAKGLITRLQRESSGQSSNATAQGEPSTLSQRSLDQLWARMAEIYGHRWVSSYGEIPTDTWAKGLYGLTTRQLADGLNECMKAAQGWPPTLPEFRAMCLPEKVENAAMYKRHDMLALPSPPRDYSKARPFLQSMKGALARKDRDERSS